MNDVHAPFVADLAGRNDWPSLVRYWIAHSLHRPRSMPRLQS